MENRRFQLQSRKYATIDEKRQHRALSRKAEQNHKRKNAILNRRMISTPLRENIDVQTPKSDSNKSNLPKPISSTKKYTKNEIQVLGHQRYESLQRWKKQKEKLLSLQKKSSIVPFKTGLVQADAPLYLVGDSDQGKGISTPWKAQSLIKSSTKKVNSVAKSTITPKPRIVALEFHIGDTPKNSSKLIGKSESKLVRLRPRKNNTPQITHGHKKNCFTPGVAPLPNTPSEPRLSVNSCAGKGRVSIWKNRDKSFAPKNFNFEAPVGVDEYSLQPSEEESKSKNIELGDLFAKELTSIQEQNKEFELPNDCSIINKNVVIIDEHDVDDIDSKVSGKYNTSFTNTDYVENISDNKNLSFVVSVINQENISFMETGSNKENDLVLENSTLSPTKSPSKVTFASLPLSRSPEPSPQCSVSPDFGSMTEVPCLRLNAGSTPGPAPLNTSSDEETPIIKTRPRRSKRLSTNIRLTPTNLILRPRTPCSRSTRKSKLVHCDEHNLVETPLKKGRKSKATPRRSTRQSKLQSIKNNSEVLNIDEQNLDSCEGTEFERKADELMFVNEIEEPSDVKNTSNASVNTDFKTPLVVPLSKKKSPCAASVPRLSWMVEESPFVVKCRGSSQKTKQKIGTPMSDLELFFADEEIGASPVLPAHRKSTKNIEQLDETEAQIDNCNQKPISLNLDEDERQLALNELLKPTINTNSDTPELSSWGESSFNISSSIAQEVNVVKASRRSRRSVSFAMMPDSKGENKLRLPSTPLKPSVRVSMGLFSQENIDSVPNAEFDSDHDLIQWGSPVVKNSHRSPKQSLLPGLTSCPEEVIPFSGEDLMAFNSPLNSIENKLVKDNNITPQLQSLSVSKKSRSSRRTGTPGIRKSLRSHEAVDLV